jgi:glycosyltransferase involved in cell wall biosynthesis
MSSQTSPLVKVVITTYNRRSWATEAIDSALAQTHRPIHIVIVDDASTDGTAQLARSYQEQHPDKVTAICKPENRGLADSVATGMRAESGADFVAILNDDDAWLPMKLERQLERFRDHPELGLVYCEAQIVDDHGKPTGELFSDLFGRLGHGDAFSNLLHANRACASTPLLRKDLAEMAAATMPDPSLVSDYYMMLLAAGYSRVEFIEEPLALYRKTASGLHTADHEMWRDTTRARRQLFARNPPLVRRVGGKSLARRTVALLTVDVAIRKLRERSWGEYLWHAGVTLKQCSPRGAGALLLHTAKELRP